MANLTEEEIVEMIDAAVRDERNRCAWFAEELARIHSRGAVKTRKDGSYTVRALIPFMKLMTVVRPGWEKMAQAQDGAARSLRVVAQAIREGWRLPHPDCIYPKCIVDGLRSPECVCHHPENAKIEL